MNRTVPLLIGLGLVTVACQEPAERPADTAPETPPATEPATVEPRGSIMRPDVLAEADPPAAPLPPPVEGQVLFGLGETGLSDEARAMLDALVEGKDLTEPMWRLTLTGRTDASGDPQVNQRLAQERAESVRDYLVEKGIPADRIAIVAAGAPEPGEDRSGTPMQDRRVDIRAEARAAED
ncbi:OmpA family protein [Brevundimonas sp. A19_0]|uniref:OmpA family protein n=1 Tax=Brevundimonas sp. A19_0 TaxID=2821087 RepID=UPI001ADA0DA7|nr:OmpA family protein [Brevundimonas sp. A19_0]MBO9500587.1 OmpA family protein [Brevundimonas sp. A19_0]